MMVLNCDRHFGSTSGALLGGALAGSWCAALGNQFGAPGKCKDYKPYSCTQIMNIQTPSNSKEGEHHHGCPLRNMYVGVG